MMKTVKDPRVKRHNARWTQDEVDTLVQMIIDGKTTSEVAKALGRTKASVWTRKSTLQLGSDVRLGNSRNSAVVMPMSIGTKARRTKSQIAVDRARAKGKPGRPAGSKNKVQKPAQTTAGLAEVLAQAKALGLKVTITLS